jgi:hypothetical protein
MILAIFDDASIFMLCLAGGLFILLQIVKFINKVIASIRQARDFQRQCSQIPPQQTDDQLKDFIENLDKHGKI